ncbi:MAG: transcription antitermination factor NusB [Actinomycetota bacterium]
MSTARGIAAQVIGDVCERGAYSNLALRSALRATALDRRDRDLATELTYGTLRRLRRIDHAIGRDADRPVPRMSERARTLLRLGTYQLLELRIPPHAAVGETVSLATGRERGYVNAILRALAADPPPLPEGDGNDAIGIRAGMSPWIVGELRNLVGDGDLERAAGAFAERAPLCVRANPCVANVEELEASFREAGLDPRRGVIAPDCLLVEGSAVEDLPGYARGAFAVQDQASAFVGHAVGALAGERVLDACAGPGGKAGILACAVAPDGHLVAADVGVGRALLAAGALRRLRTDASPLVQDARRPALRPGTFDRVLVDAPCTGIGSARRRPELLWRPDEGRLSELARLQVAIATAVADLLRPGGRLVYSVCTFPRAETVAVCDALVRARPDLVPTAIDGPDGPSERIRLWPHLHGTDGMFLAGFTKGRSPPRGGGPPGEGGSPR